MVLTDCERAILTGIYLADVCEVTFSRGVVLDGKRVPGPWQVTLACLLDAGLLSQWRGGWVLTDAGLDVLAAL